jgi:hypothetical protein
VYRIYKQYMSGVTTYNETYLGSFGLPTMADKKASEFTVLTQLLRQPFRAYGSIILVYGR